MSVRVNSVGIWGLDTCLVEVEVHITKGLPGFQIVGLPDQQVRESRDRVRAAIQNSGFEFPARKITVNLAPAALPKTGPFYDLPIAMGIIVELLRIERKRLRKLVVSGELALDGTVRPVTGVIAMVEYALRNSLTALVPDINRAEAQLVSGADVAGVRTLFESISFLRGEFEGHREPLRCSGRVVSESGPDFSEIAGHQLPKRALEIAAAGKHNLLFVGPPGVGKSMLARSLCTILPPMSFSESLETTRIFSVAGMLPPGHSLIEERVFRNPHHTVSFIGLIGGGKDATPGEVTLAHNGVLFLDELPEFQRRTLEVLREPLEERRVLISRASRAVMYPADFWFISAMNPCPCGYFGDPDHHCSCNPSRIERYIGRISGPVLERIDIQVEVGRVDFDGFEKNRLEPSAAVRERVTAAARSQLDRNGGKWNAAAPRSLIADRFSVDKKAEKLVKSIVSQMNLSMRSLLKITRVARTIADLEGKSCVGEEEILEASGYRLLDRKLWNF